MPGIQATASIALNATNTNVFANLQYQILPFDAICEFGFQGAATGLRLDLSLGGDAICSDWAVPLQNRFPIWPDDTAFVEEALAMDQIVAQMRNTTGAAIIHFSAVRITPA